MSCYWLWYTSICMQINTFRHIPSERQNITTIHRLFQESMSYMLQVSNKIKTAVTHQLAFIHYFSSFRQNSWKNKEMQPWRKVCQQKPFFTTHMPSNSNQVTTFFTATARTHFLSLTSTTWLLKMPMKPSNSSQAGQRWENIVLIVHTHAKNFDRSPVLVGLFKCLLVIVLSYSQVKSVNRG